MSNIFICTVLLTCANALPSFPSSPYTATVSELTPVGTTLLNITAVPGTPGNTLTYSIFNNPPIIEIDTVTGSVILVGPLDYEQETMYQFNVQAHEGSDVAMKQVTVSVLNENDNPLTCNRTLIIHTVAEGPTQDSSSVPLSCLDRDEPMPGSISYQIESTNNTSLFSIDSTGTIHITSSLDYEQETQHEVMVNVTSGGDGGAAATTPDSTLLVTVLIIVESVNEFSPTFDSDETLTLSLSEDTAVGSTVGAVNASDADRGCDGELTFSIISEKFAIESLTGQLVLIETLDYEREGFHELTVIVSDHPRDESQRRSTTATVDITVENVNEYPPQFSQAVYSVSVLETEGLGNELIMLMCTDGDSDSTLSYSITSDNNTNHFIIDPFSGTVALASEIEFDPMLPSPLSLTVQCIDSGSPSRSVEALLLTTVVGINRNIPPSLNTTEYVVEVNENTPPGTVMVDTLSSDVTDSNRGLAGPLQFTLVHGATCSQDTFQIDSVSGTLYTVGHLDHETLAEHHCTVSVANTGSTTTAEFDVKVSVTNTNDEVPLCLPSLYTLTLPEDSVVGSHVLTLSCTDADGDGLQYSIEGSSTVFKLTQNATQTSTLSLVAPLDSDVLSTHNIRINVSDGHHSTQLMVFVYVEPSNEHVPVFNQSVYDCSVSETASIGSVFCAVMAEDSDAGADGTTTYSITSGNEQNTFAINSSTGGLVLAGFIDYELVQGYLIVVQATDNGKSPLSTSVQVRITVIDDNDNAPIISPLITSTVAENLTAGSTVTMLDCSDIDSGPNGEVTMAIESQLNAEGISSSVFTIYSLTNELIASTDIDYESSVVYTVTLTCRDNGSVPLASSSMIVISVSPVNEFAPVISQANYSLTIPENSTVGTIILKVIATDSDRGLDGHILFSIEPEESGRDFLQISETSGDITTQQLLNCDWGQEHVFTVTATDEGTPALGSQSRLLVTLSNCRLGELIPGEVVYLANVTENSPADTEVTVVACDYNRTLWQGSGAVEYAITSPTTSPFQVDPLSGQISLTAPPDYEQSASHMLQISCSDPSDSQSRVSFSVYIAILPLNEHPPQFTLSAYTAEVGEDALPGTSVLRVEAADDDAGRDGSLVYSIVESEHPFVVDSKTGEIYTGDFLDRETKSMHTFHVVVADQEAQGDSVRSSMTEITVDIVDSNDNPPRCDRVVYHVTLSPLSDTGHRVVEPVCTDADSGLNSELTYSLHVDSFTSLEMFTLDEETGVLSLAHQFTATSSPVVHEMVITVEDGGTPPLSVAALVLVELERGSLVGTDEMQEGGESPVEAEGTKNAINFTLMDMSLELVSLYTQPWTLLHVHLFYRLCDYCSTVECRGYGVIPVCYGSQCHLLLCPNA